MDPTRIERATSTMPLWRSPKLSYGPDKFSKVRKTYQTYKTEVGLATSVVEFSEF